jgi:2-methylcitrate dehydratase PrpD
MTITLKSGGQKTAELSNPIGHHDRPMSDAQVVEKFRGLAGRKLAPAQLEKILDRMWKIDGDADWPSLFDELRVNARVHPPLEGEGRRNIERSEM